MSNIDEKVFAMVSEGADSLEIFKDLERDWSTMTGAEIRTHLKNNFKMKEIRDFVAADEELAAILNFDAETYNRKKEEFMNLLNAESGSTKSLRYRQTQAKRLWNEERMRDLHAMGFGQDTDEQKLSYQMKINKSMDDTYAQMVMNPEEISFQIPTYTGYFNPETWGVNKSE